MLNLQLKKLMKARIHEGYRVNKWDPATGAFLFCQKEKVHVIDLEQTILMLKRVLLLVERLVMSRGNLLYIPLNLKKRKKFIMQTITSIPKIDYNYSRKRWNSRDHKFRKRMFKNRLNTIERQRKNFDGFKHDWDQSALRIRTSSTRLFSYKNPNVFKLSNKSNKTMGDNFANSLKLFESEKFTINYRRIEELKIAKEKRDKKFFYHYKDKIFSLLSPKKKKNLTSSANKKIKRNSQLFWNRERTELPFIPEVIFLSDVNPNEIIIKESLKLNIPIIGVINSNSNPAGIQFPIPGNNATNESLHFYLSLIVKSIAKGKVKEIQKWNFSKKRLQFLRFSRIKRVYNRRNKILKRKSHLKRKKYGQLRKRMVKKIFRRFKIKNRYRRRFISTWHLRSSRFKKKLKRFWRKSYKKIRYSKKVLKFKKWKDNKIMFLRKRKGKRKNRRYNKQRQLCFSTKKFRSSNSFLKFKHRFIMRRPLTNLFRKVSLYYSLRRARSKLDILKYKKMRKERLSGYSRKLKKRKFYFLQKIFRSMKKSNLILFKRLQKHFSKSSYDPLLSKHWFHFFKKKSLFDKNSVNSIMIKKNSKYKKIKSKRSKKIKKSKLFKSLFFSLFFSKIQSDIEFVNSLVGSLNLDQKKIGSTKNQKKIEKKKKLKRKKFK